MRFNKKMINSTSTSWFPLWSGCSWSDSHFGIQKYLSVACHVATSPFNRGDHIVRSRDFVHPLQPVNLQDYKTEGGGRFTPDQTRRGGSECETDWFTLAFSSRGNPLLVRSLAVGELLWSWGMDSLQSHRVEMLSLAVALVAIGAGTAYYFYIHRKPKGTFYSLTCVSVDFWIQVSWVAMMIWWIRLCYI